MIFLEVTRMIDYDKQSTGFYGEKHVRGDKGFMLLLIGMAAFIVWAVLHG